MVNSGLTYYTWHGQHWTQKLQQGHSCATRVALKGKRQAMQSLWYGGTQSWESYALPLSFFCRQHLSWNSNTIHSLHVFINIFSNAGWLIPSVAVAQHLQVTQQKDHQIGFSSAFNLSFFNYIFARHPKERRVAPQPHFISPAWFVKLLSFLHLSFSSISLCSL